MKTRNNRSGITLAETLAVLLILTILVGLAYPMGRGLRERAIATRQMHLVRLLNAAEQLYEQECKEAQWLGTAPLAELPTNAMQRLQRLMHHGYLHNIRTNQLDLSRLTFQVSPFYWYFQE